MRGGNYSLREGWTGCGTLLGVLSATRKTSRELSLILCVLRGSLTICGDSLPATARPLTSTNWSRIKPIQPNHPLKKLGCSYKGQGIRAEKRLAYQPSSLWISSDNRLAIQLQQGMVATGSDRWSDCSRCGHSQGDGLCNDCGTSCTGGTLHRVRADDHLRGAWNISAS